MTSSRFSFRKAWAQVPMGKLTEVQARIMAALKLQTKNTFYIRLRGEVEPKVSEAEAIESIFADYGITDVWGD